MMVTFTWEHLLSLSKQGSLFPFNRKEHNLDSSAKLKFVAEARMYPFKAQGTQSQKYISLGFFGSFPDFGKIS